MKQYSLNTLQFHSLTAILNCTKKEIALRIGVSPVKTGRHLEDGDFKVEELLDLCNAYRLPISAFITTEESPVIRSVMQEDEDAYIPVRFSNKKLNGRINVKQTSYSQMMRATGFARKTLDTIIDGKCHISQLLEYCNAMCYNLSDFIKGCDTLPCIINEVSDIKAQNIRLRSENMQLRLQIAELREMLEQLRNRQNNNIQDIDLVAE